MIAATIKTTSQKSIPQKSTSHLVISIVSHNHGALLHDLLTDLGKFCDERVEILLTLNTPETLPFSSNDFKIPITIIKNSMPKGFGANHNAAFKRSTGQFFCVLNPDIRLTVDPFAPLLEKLNDTRVGVVAPLVVDVAGRVQDNARKFPNPRAILKRICTKHRTPDYAIEQSAISTASIVSTVSAVEVDWVAGMFMLFRRDVFAQLNGFDERFFLYCEDVDICARAHALNYQVLLDPTVTVIHNAQRDSHKRLRYLWWHVTSLLRFFCKRY